jgi:hypothetical protein
MTYVIVTHNNFPNCSLNIRNAIVLPNFPNCNTFLAIKTTYNVGRLAKEYVDEIVRLHCAPVTIISNRDPCFTSRFCQSLQIALGTKLSFSTTFHP